MLKPGEIAQIVEGYDEEDWLDFLDELDAVTRRRRQRHDEPDPPAGDDRDAMAAWIARKHILADRGVRQIWYLPGNAPANEIRLLEISDHVAGTTSNSPVQAIEFGLDINEHPFRLFVADISDDELDDIKLGRLHLPQGWILNGNQRWGRRN